MNSKVEWHQPVVARVVVTRELEELEVQGLEEEELETEEGEEYKAEPSWTKWKSSLKLSVADEEPECSESLQIKFQKFHFVNSDKTTLL